MRWADFISSLRLALSVEDTDRIECEIRFLLEEVGVWLAELVDFHFL